jgi:hypothetical protein
VHETPCGRVIDKKRNRFAIMRKTQSRAQNTGATSPADAGETLSRKLRKGHNHDGNRFAIAFHPGVLSPSLKRVGGFYHNFRGNFSRRCGRSCLLDYKTKKRLELLLCVIRCSVPAQSYLK